MTTASLQSEIAEMQTVITQKEMKEENARKKMDRLLRNMETYFDQHVSELKPIAGLFKERLDKGGMISRSLQSTQKRCWNWSL